MVELIKKTRFSYETQVSITQPAFGFLIRKDSYWDTSTRFLVYLSFAQFYLTNSSKLRSKKCEHAALLAMKARSNEKGHVDHDCLQSHNNEIAAK